MMRLCCHSRDYLGGTSDGVPLFFVRYKIIKATFPGNLNYPLSNFIKILYEYYSISSLYLPFILIRVVVSPVSCETIIRDLFPRVPIYTPWYSRINPHP